MFDNIILLTDSYKVSHAAQYPPGTEVVGSYFESRGGEFRETVFNELQYLLMRYLEGQVVTREKIDEAEKVLTQHLGPGVFNRANWEYILSEHNGKLPVRIRAVPEGTVVPTKNVLMTIENTDPKCFWLTNYLETLLVQVWYGCTVGTISREMKKIIHAALVRSGNPELIDFKLHDFGFRGVSSVESAAIGGFAHLINFQGTDTIAALEMASKYYGAETIAGFSIPATEHSTITSWGKEGELAAYRNILKTYPTGLVACVSDSWDIYNACKHLWGRELKPEVLKRDGTLVIRPDSGEPTEVLPKILNILGNSNVFGAITNDKGYKVLPDKVRVIQGDGIRRSTLKGILDSVMDAGWSADNLAFGSGGGLLQDCNRDTLNFAFKCSYVKINGELKEVYKAPATASWKTSKKGELALVKDKLFETTHGNQYATVPLARATSFGGNQLVTIFEDGELYNRSNLKQMRERAKL